MADKYTAPTPAALLDEPMQTVFDLVGQLTASGLNPAEVREVLRAMVGRVLATHPATAHALGANE